MNEICNKYCDLIKTKFSNRIKSIIIYGSNIYNEKNSDLDVCLIVEENDLELQKSIIDETIDFHRKNNLKMDEEIPYDNKLIYTLEEINETLNSPPFYKAGKVIICDVVKSKEFLASKEMKQRLLLNILTTDHITFGDSTAEYELKAFRIIINVVISYFQLKNFSENELLEHMYTNKYTGATGEMYLGYKKNYKEKEKYLRKKISEVLR